MDAMARFIIGARNDTQAAFEQANAGLRKMENKVKSMNQTAGSFGRVLGAAGLTAGITAFGRSVLRAGDEAGDLAERADISTESIQSLKIVADDAGVRIDRLVGMFNDLKGKMAEAQVEGGEKLLAAFNALGVSMEMLKANNVEATFEQMAKAMAAGAGNASVIASAHDILGASTEKLAPVFRAAAMGMAELNAQMKANGEILSDAEVATLSKADRTLTKFKNKATVAAASYIQGWMDDTASSEALFGVQKGYQEGGFQGILKNVSRGVRSLFTPGDPLLEQAYGVEAGQNSGSNQLRPFRPVVPPMLRPESANPLEPDLAISVLDQIKRGIDQLNQNLMSNLGPVVGQ